MAIKLKPLYYDRIKTLKREIYNIEEYSIKRKNIIDDYIKLIDETLEDIKKISNDDKIDNNIKYIKLNEKTSDIEKITNKIDVLYNEILNKTNYIIKEKEILLQNCIKDHSNFSEIDIILEINSSLNS
jgi:hypothetical protein